jgi:predicted nucleic acid-binding protein
LIRLHKCEALDKLTNTLHFLVAEHAHEEFSASGPSARAALERLQASKRSIIPGSPEWKNFSLIRNSFSTVDLGEDQSIALALTEADRGKQTPLVTYDYGAEKKANALGVITISFLETLAWLMSCKKISLQEAEKIEARATARDGWRRPIHQVGPLGDLVDGLCRSLSSSIEVRKPRKKQRRIE